MVNITKIKVRYAETDQMGVVYYANYFVWMEIGRTNLLRDLGLTYKELENNGIMLPVVKAFAKYISPCYYDDDINIHSIVTSLTNVRIRIDYKIFRENNILSCLGFTEHAFVSTETKKVIKAPEFFIKNIVIPENIEEYITKI